MRPKLIELWASPECSGVSGRVYNLILDNSMCWLCPLVSQCSNILLTKQNQNHFSKDCRLPVQLQRAMAAEAEAAREARAKVMKTKQAKLYFLLKSRLSPTPGDRSGRGTKSCSSSEGSIRDHFREFLCDAAEISSSEFKLINIFKSKKLARWDTVKVKTWSCYGLIFLKRNHMRNPCYQTQTRAKLEIQQLDNWLDASASNPHAQMGWMLSDPAVWV